MVLLFAVAEHKLNLVCQEHGLPLEPTEAQNATKKEMEEISTALGGDDLEPADRARLEASLQILKERVEQHERALGALEGAYALFGRLRHMEKALGCLHAHLIRHANQSTFKQYMLGESTGVGFCASVFVIDDYWAKQAEYQRWMATCENGKGNKTTSVFGRVGKYLNPSKAIREKHKDHDWADYPPPPEDQGPTYVRVSIRAFSDTSTQDTLDTAHTRGALDDALFAQNPWLAGTEDKAGGVAVQSDGASNFSSKQAVIMNYLNPRVSCVLISVEGMGKDAVDSDNAVCQAKFASAKAGDLQHMACASDFRAVLEDKKHAGEWNLIAQPHLGDSTASGLGDNVGDAVQGRHKFFVFDRDQREIVVYEMFDHAESVRLGQPVGYGPGRKLPVAGLGITEALERKEWKAFENVLVEPEVGVESGGTPHVVPAQQLSHDEKAKAKREKIEKKKRKREEIARVKAGRREHARRVSELFDVLPRGVSECPTCRTKLFGTGATSARHECAKSRHTKAQEARKALREQQVAHR